MAKISDHGMHEWKRQNLAKLSKAFKFCVAYVGKTDKMSENNKIVGKLASCLIKTRF